MLMRFTIVDSGGTISFRGPGHGLKMIAAAVSEGAITHRDVLDRLAALDESLAITVRRGLAIFDEHCVREQPATIRAWTEDRPGFPAEPFRVLNDVTKRASLEPGRLGLVIFNLRERRIVQVQNSYGALMRHDRGRVREQGRPVRRYYRYELSSDWSIVP